MSVIYHVYGNTAKVPYQVQYCCEKCGAKNSFVHYHEINHRFSDKSAFTTAGEQRIKKEGEKKFRQKVSDKTKLYEAQIKSREYRRLRIPARCSQCRHRPFWAHPDGILMKALTWLKDISLMFGLSALLLTAVGLIASIVSKDSAMSKYFPFPGIWILLLIWAPALVYYAWIEIGERICERKLGKADPSTLPSIKRTKG